MGKKKSGVECKSLQAHSHRSVNIVPDLVGVMKHRTFNKLLDVLRQ